MLHRDSDGSGEFDWGRFGFLVADLFTALAVLFLVANTIGHVQLPPPKAVVTSPASPTSPPTATPTICGLDPHPASIPSLAVIDPVGLRQLSSSAESSFVGQIRSALQAYRGKVAGLAEVWGGSYQGSADVKDGESLANGAIAGLRTLSNSHFIFSNSTIYQPFWDGDIGGSDVMLLIFFYTVSSDSQCSGR